jgi:hypothetical protein
MVGRAVTDTRDFFITLCSICNAVGCNKGSHSDRHYTLAVVDKERLTAAEFRIAALEDRLRSEGWSV